MESLEGKRLLVLGGTALLGDVVEKAKSMGIYTIVTDYNTPNKSPAKKLADEYWMDSISDTNMLVNKIKQYGIDGVITNYTDSYLPFYVDLCEKAGLPCLANKRQIQTITNKDLSKQLCKDHGISVSKRYDVKSIEDIDKITDFQFPVLTKPIDNSGQRGIFVCTNKEDLKKYYTKSLEFSSSKNVMIEEYVQGDYTVMFYTVQKGRVTLSTMSDKPVYGRFEHNLPKLPLGYLLPSRYVDLCKEKVLPKVQAFVSDLEIQNGVIGIEAVIKNNDIYVFEMQYRLGGMRHHNFVLKENGMDILAMLVSFAITGKFDGWDAREYDNAAFRHTYCSLNVLVQPDKVARIEGFEEVCKMPQIISSTQMLFVGDEVKLPGTVNQIFSKFSIETEDKQSMANVISKIFDLLNVFNDKGESIIIRSDSLMKTKLIGEK